MYRSLIDKGLVTAVHDCADGGAAVAVAEMALAGNISMTMTSFKSRTLSNTVR
jgi:phosphoribosylformylglycinamidine synthase